MTVRPWSQTRPPSQAAKCPQFDCTIGYRALRSVVFTAAASDGSAQQVVADAATLQLSPR